MEDRVEVQDPRHVRIVNAWHDLNAGDSAIADVCIALAKKRWPGSSMVVHTMLSSSDPAFADWNRHLKLSHPDVDYRPAPYPEPPNGGSVLSRRLELAVRSARSLPLLRVAGRRPASDEDANCRALVVVGGSDLFALDSPRLLPDLRLARLLQPAVDAASAGTPVHFWGHTLGPFDTRRSVALMRRVLETASEVVVRETRSRDLALSIAPTAVVRELPDLAFALDGDLAGRDPRGRVIFVPRAQIHANSEVANAQLVSGYAELARRLIDLDRCKEVLVVPQVGGPGDREIDLRICERIVASADRGAVIVGPVGLGPRELRRLYAGSEAVFAVRLHGAILAMSAGVPSFAISYFTAKTGGVMASVGAENSWCEWDDFSPERALAWFDTERLELASTLSERVAAHRNQIVDVLRRDQNAQ